MKVPKTGDIYDSQNNLIGNRDPNTGVFTGVGSWVLVSDDPCGNNNLLLDDNNIALKDDNGAFLFGD